MASRKFFIEGQRAGRWEWKSSTVYKGDSTVAMDGIMAVWPWVGHMAHCEECSRLATHVAIAMRVDTYGSLSGALLSRRMREGNAWPTCKRCAPRLVLVPAPSKFGEGE